jgi:hypothetical protein
VTQTAPLAPPPPDSRPALTARRIALAVVASAAVYGDDPALALTPGKNPRHRRCLSPAASGLALATGHPLGAVCGVMKLHPTTVPTARRLGGEMFTCAALAAERAVLDDLRATPKVEPVAELAPAPAPRPESRPRPEVQPTAVQEPAPSPPKARSKPGAVLANTLLGQQPVMSRPPVRPEPKAEAPTDLAAPRPVNPGAAIASRRMSRVIRMTRVTPPKLRYARWFLDARWPLEDVAFLFDVGADALADAVQAERVA